MAVIVLSQKLLNILDELESLKPEVNRRVRELNEVDSKHQLLQLDGPETTSYDSQTSLAWPSENKKWPSINVKQVTLISTLQ